MAKILIIGVGNSGSSIIDRMAKENMTDTNLLKIKDSSDNRDLDSKIPILELAKEDHIRPNTEFYKCRATEMEDEIRKVIISRLNDSPDKYEVNENSHFEPNRRIAEVSLSDKPPMNKDQILTYKVICWIGIGIISYIALLYLIVG